MEKNLTKYNNIIIKRISNNSRSKEIKTVKINREVIILKVQKRCNKHRYFHEKKIYLRLKDEDILYII